MDEAEILKKWNNLNPGRLLLTDKLSGVIPDTVCGFLVKYGLPNQVNGFIFFQPYEMNTLSTFEGNFQNQYLVHQGERNYTVGITPSPGPSPLPRGRHPKGTRGGGNSPLHGDFRHDVLDYYVIGKTIDNVNYIAVNVLTNAVFAISRYSPSTTFINTDLERFVHAIITYREYLNDPRNFTREGNYKYLAQLKNKLRQNDKYSMEENSLWFATWQSLKYGAL
jgi:hypothetical protein